MPRLILFDIDGTLIGSGGAGQRAMARAFEDVFGIHDVVHRVPLAGRTDRLIMADVFELAEAAHQADEPAIERFNAVYAGHLREEMEVDAPGKGVMPGVRALLEALSARDEVALALLTGNFEPAARIKLEYFDLWKYFGWGVFGHEALDRSHLMPIALERAHAHGLAIDDPSRVWVIGDTPNDVACARAGGTRVVAVATGLYSLDELRACGPDVAVSDLSDTAGMMRLLVGRDGLGAV